MWCKAVFSVALFGIVSVIFAEVIPEKLKVRCGRGKIVQGKAISVKSICNSNYSVVADGILSRADIAYPLKLAVSIIDDNKVEWNVGEMEIANVVKENITDFVPISELTIPDDGCSIRGASVIFELKDMNAVLYKAAERKRIFCDNSGVDLAYVATGTTTIYLSDTAKSLKAAMANVNLQVQAKNLGTTLRTFPTQEGVPIGIFGAAFVKKYKDGMPLTETECLDNGFNVPELGDKDIIVGHELFKANTELPSNALLESVMMNEDELHICGDYVLVFLIDPLDTLGNEGNRCNNFVTFRIESSRTCDSVPSRCELIRNAWSNGEARVMYKSTKRSQEMESTGSTFELEEEEFKGVDEKDEWEMKFTKSAFGRLKLLGQYIERQIEENSQLCVDEPGAMVKEMEEDTDFTSDDSDTETLPVNVMKAAEFVMQLSDTTSDASVIQTALTALLSKTNEDTSFRVKMEMAMEIRALETALSVNNQTVSGDDSAFCELPRHLEELQWADEHSVDNYELIELAREIVSAYISKPDLSCLQRILKRFLMFANKIDMKEHVDTSELIADEESLAVEKDLKRCAKPIKCLKKLRRMCTAKDIANWQEVDDGSKAEICKMYVMKKFAKEHYMALGMMDLYDKIIENNDMHGEKCNRDPLKPDSPRSQAFWKEEMEDGRQFIYQGMVNNDASKIAWRKKAVCTCSECAHGSGSEKTDDGMPGTDAGMPGTDDGNPDKVGDEIKRRRRRR